MSDSIPMLTAAEVEAINLLLKDTRGNVQQQCVAANSDWPMCEVIYVSVLFRCSEEAFASVLELFAEKTKNHLWYAATSPNLSNVHTFSTVDAAILRLFFECVSEYAPSAYSDTEEIRFEYV